MQKSFLVLFNMEEVGIYDNFVDAFRVFWQKVLQSLEDGTSWQVLETCNFIVMVDGEANKEWPLGFYDARDLAYDIGLLSKVEGEAKPIVLDRPGEENWEEMVSDKYQAAVQAVLQQSLDNIVNLTKSILRRLER